MNKARVLSILAALALLFSFATVSPARAALPKVALLGSETGNRLTDIVNKVTAAGAGLYAVTNLSGCPLGTPTLATLQQYDVVMVWSDCGFSNPTTLGNVLADYVDGGGRVVVAAHVWWNGFNLPIQGRFASGGYNPLNPGTSGVGAGGVFLAADIPSSPLLAGVTSFEVGSWDNTTSVAAGATLVAHTNPLNFPLVAYKGNVVALNFFPASSDAQAGFWTSSTDGARLMANALLFNSTPPDTTAPTASPSQSPVANDVGWNNSDVTITWNWADEAGGSGIDSGNCTTSSGSSGEGASTLNATCKDLAGNTGNASYLVKVDKTAPKISAAATTPPNGAGWYNSDVTVSFTCDDAGSGIPAGACPADQTLSAEGTGIASSPQTVTDAAGNTSDASNIVTVNIDKTAPTLNPIVSPNPVALNGAATVASGAADGLSGMVSQGCDPLDTSSAGAKSVTCTATDSAGNTNNTTASYTVLSPAEQIDALITTINSFNLGGGTANSLTSKLNNATKSLGKGNTNAACNQVDAFINQVNALSGNQLTPAQAAQLLASANQLKASIGCA